MPCVPLKLVSDRFGCNVSMQSIKHVSAAEKGLLGNVVLKQLPFADYVQHHSGWEDPHLDFPLYCVFSQAGRVTDLWANEAQCSAVMEKTHVGPTGGRIYVPLPYMDGHGGISHPEINPIEVVVLGLKKSWNKVKLLPKSVKALCCGYLQLTWCHAAKPRPSDTSGVIKQTPQN